MNMLLRLSSETPLIEDGVLTALLNQIALLDDASQAAESPFRRYMREALRPTMTVTADGLAVIPVEGILAFKPDPWEMMTLGIEDSRMILEMVETAAGNPDVRAILLDVNSPGGFVTGGQEIADAVKAATAMKPVMAWTGGQATSLAYWIASQAEEVITAPSALVGGMGAFKTHLDLSKHLEAMGVNVEIIRNKEGVFKAVGVLGTALTNEQRAHVQAQVDAGFASFRAAVKMARPGIGEDAMRGQVFSGTEAKQAGLVDRIGDRAFALGLLRRAVRARAT